MTSKPGKPKDRHGGWSMRGPKLKLRHALVLQSGRWMGRRANTRVPALLMVLGYPATLVLVLLSPFVVVGLGLLATLVIWHVSYRSVVRPGEVNSSRISVAADWATRVSLLVPAYLGWLLLVRWGISDAGDDRTGVTRFALRVRALLSAVFDGRWFLGYCTVSVLAWLAIFKAPHVVARHTERTSAEASPFRQFEEFEGARILTRKATRTGERFKLDITRTGKGPSEFVKDNALKERIAGHEGLGASRVIVEPVTKHAGQIEVTIRRRDPWARALPHPAAPDFPRGRRRISDPIVLGLEPEEGAELALRLMTGEGGQHVMIIAGTRGGKTVLSNSIVEALTRAPEARRDVDICMIDPTKGKDGRAWAPAVAESFMGPENIPAALDALERHVALIASRARSNRGAVWKPGYLPDRRAKLIIFDEADALLASTDQAIAGRAKAAVKYIVGKGASELVLLVVMAQRGVLAYLGTNDVGANAFIKIMLGVAKRGEMQYVVPDWEALGMPDMSKYGEGRKGVVLLAPVGQQWAAGRTWNLSDLATVRGIAASRVIQDPAHLALLAAEQEYARRHPDPENDDPEVKAELARAADLGDPDLDPGSLTHEPPEDGTNDPDPEPPWGSAPAPEVPTMTPRSADPDLPRELTPRERALLGFGKPSTPGGGWRPASNAEIVRKTEAAVDAARSTVDTIDAALRTEMRRPLEETAQRWATRRAATVMTDQDETVPAAFTDAVLRMVADRGPVSRQDVVAASGLGKSTVAVRLRILVNQGTLRRVGGGGAGTRYTRPE